MKKLIIPFIFVISLSACNYDNTNQTEENKYILSEVIIKDKGLTEVPDYAFFDTNIKFLSLEKNELTKISDDIAKLKKLEVLNISINHIIELPNELIGLKNLKELNAGINDLKEIKSLKKLEVLYLNGCSFSDQEKKKIKELLPWCDIYFED